jgi:hypothetical protein
MTNEQTLHKRPKMNIHANASGKSKNYNPAINRDNCNTFALLPRTIKIVVTL